MLCPLSLCFLKANLCCSLNLYSKVIIQSKLDLRIGTSRINNLASQAPDTTSMPLPQSAGVWLIQCPFRGDLTRQGPVLWSVKHGNPPSPENPENPKLSALRRRLELKLAGSLAGSEACKGPIYSFGAQGVHFSFSIEITMKIPLLIDGPCVACLRPGAGYSETLVRLLHTGYTHLAGKRCPPQYRAHMSLFRGTDVLFYTVAECSSITHVTILATRQ